jgi:hypothetical protein
MGLVEILAVWTARPCHSTAGQRMVRQLIKDREAGRIVFTIETMKDRAKTRIVAAVPRVDGMPNDYCVAITDTQQIVI